jgi:hypothetical protein
MMRWFKGFSGEFSVWVKCERVRIRMRELFDSWNIFEYKKTQARVDKDLKIFINFE